MKEYKFSILLGLMWFVVAQVALYSHLNGWTMNPWVEFNFYGFALLGWGLILPMAMFEAWYEDKKKNR